MKTIHIFLIFYLSLLTGCQSSIPVEQYNKTQWHDTWELVKRVAPRFPGKALHDGIFAGCVTLGFTINRDGKAESIRILGETPKKYFEKGAKGYFGEEARSALYKWRWEPKPNNQNREPAKNQINMISFTAFPSINTECITKEQIINHEKSS